MFSFHRSISICQQLKLIQFTLLKKTTVFGNLSRMSTASETINSDVESALQNKDQVQVSLMNERCILVNEDDDPVGSASKKQCHLLENINKGMLHRAFSVFLFNTKGEMLLQQRATAKITFPDHWTSTCCSHPLNVPMELDEVENMGVKRAAQRKLKHELGIESSQVPLEAFHYLTRIQYKSANRPYDGMFGEHEIDYVLFIQRDVDINVNTNEVQNYRYVQQTDLYRMMEKANSGELMITPWFKLIVDSFLSCWWSNLDSLDSVKQPQTIHRMN